MTTQANNNATTTNNETAEKKGFLSSINPVHTGVAVAIGAAIGGAAMFFLGGNSCEVADTEE